jgi:hypothetical protein
MRVIPTSIHGVIDYLTGAALIAVPYLLGFADGSAAQWVPTIAGLAILGQSLITKYELSPAKIIPMPTHLMLDMGVGAVLAASPWLFGFADQVYLPHLIVGLSEIVIAAISENRSTKRSLA